MLDNLIFNKIIQENNLVGWIQDIHRKTGFKYMFIICKPFSNANTNESKNPIVDTYLWTNDMSMDELYSNVIVFKKKSNSLKLEFFIITCPECENPNDFQIKMVRKELDAAASEWLRYQDAKYGMLVSSMPEGKIPARLEDPEAGKYASDYLTGKDIQAKCKES